MAIEHFDEARNVRSRSGSIVHRGMSGLLCLAASWSSSPNRWAAVLRARGASGLRRAPCYMEARVAKARVKNSGAIRLTNDVEQPGERQVHPAAEPTAGSCRSSGRLGAARSSLGPSRRHGGFL